MKAVDEDGGRVAGASIRSYPDRGCCDCPEERVVTGPDGRAEICEVAATGAWLLAVAPGHQKVHVTNEVGEDPFEVSLPAAGVLEGRLVPYRAGDCPCFTFFDGVGVDLEVSDDGRFTLDNVPPGDSRASFHTSWGAWLPREPYHVDAGQVTDLGDIPLEPTPPREPPTWRIPPWNPMTP